MIEVKKQLTGDSCVWVRSHCHVRDAKSNSVHLSGTQINNKVADAMRYLSFETDILRVWEQTKLPWAWMAFWNGQCLSFKIITEIFTSISFATCVVYGVAVPSYITVSLGINTTV